MPCLRRLAAYILLFICIGSTYTLQASLPKGGPAFDLSNMPQNGLIPMPTEQEMQEIEKFLSTLSDSEIEELIKYGESITKIAEENNIPLFFEPTTGAPIADNGFKSPSTPANTKRESTESKPKEKTVPAITKDDIAYYKKTLENFLTIIQTIRQRLASVKKFVTTLNDLNKELDTLIYYLHILQKETIVSHLKEKKYEALVNAMNSATTELTQLNHALDIPSADELYQHPVLPSTKKKLKIAERTVAAIKKELEALVRPDTMITPIEELLKEYEPIALQIKQKNEEKEKAAHEFAKKVPVTNVAKQAPAQAPFAAPYQAPRPNMPMTPPIKPINPTSPQKGPDASAGNKPTKMMEPIKKPQQPNKGKKSTFADLEKEIIDAFDGIENRLVPHRAHVNDFLTTYSNTKDEPEMVTAALNDANFGLKRVKSLVDDWHKKLEKDSSSKTDMETKAKGLRDTFKNNLKHNNLKNIHSKVKTVAKGGTEGSVKRFKELMDGIEKRILEIF